MKWPFAVVLLAAALASCRDYDLESRLTDQSGLVPPDRFARYGREQAQEIAVAREYGRAAEAEDLVRQAEAAGSYARTLPDVMDVDPDPLGYRLTLRLKSGWLTIVTPITDGKTGAETAGVPADTRAATKR